MSRYILLETEDGEIIDTYKKWGVILSNKENELPTPKTTYVNIEGGDGTLDLTEAFGEIKYNDRTIQYTFAMLDNFADLPQKVSEIANDINGRQFKIYHYDDLNYYYVGRLSINEFKINRARGTIVVEAVCKPYKYKKYITRYIADVIERKKILCPNVNKNVIPIITTSRDMTIIFENRYYNVSAGTHEILNIAFKKGVNEIEVLGPGKITIEYQEMSM